MISSSQLNGAAAFDRNRVNLLNEHDEIIGQADKFEAHLGKGMLHQAVSLFLFRTNALGEIELLIQKRSSQKIVGAEEWANTVCGNVAVGEKHRDCVLRRLKEELGIVLPLLLVNKLSELMVFQYAVACNEHYSENEIDHLFGLWLDEDEAEAMGLNLNPDEVDSYEWVNWLDLLKQQSCLGKTFTPWFKIFMQNPEIIANIGGFLKDSSFLKGKNVKTTNAC